MSMVLSCFCSMFIDKQNNPAKLDGSRPFERIPRDSLGGNSRGSFTMPSKDQILEI